MAKYVQKMRVSLVAGIEPLLGTFRFLAVSDDGYRRGRR